MHPHAHACVHVTITMLATRRKFKCQLCQEFARDTYPSVLRHIGEVHSFGPNFHIICGLTLDSTRAECPAIYTKYGSFRSHVYKKHRQIMNLHPTQPIDDDPLQLEDGSNSNEDVHQEESHHELIELQDHDAGDVDTSGEANQVTRAAALFILRTMEVHKISQVVMHSFKIQNIGMECNWGEGHLQINLFNHNRVSSIAPARLHNHTVRDLSWLKTVYIYRRQWME